MTTHKLPKRLILLAVILFISITSCKQNTEAHEQEDNSYEDLLLTMYERGQFNGNVMVIKQGEIVYQGSFGIKNIDPLDSSLTYSRDKIEKLETKKRLK